MNSYERIKRMYEHREADRIPITDKPWAGTIRRWRAEGMPANVEWEDYFDVDKVGVFMLDNSPRYERRILEENDRWYIETSEWGVTRRCFKQEDSTPEYLDYRVIDEESWEHAKKRMMDDTDRIPWKQLKEDFARWRAEGRWIRGIFWFGFDVTHSHMMGRGFQALQRGTCS